MDDNRLPPDNGGDSAGVKVDRAASPDELADSLLRLWRTWRKISHPTRKAGITQEQYLLLHRLYHRGQLSIGELANGLGITPSSATIATKRLEKTGFLERKRLKEDERIVEVSLTPAGAEVLKEWAGVQRRVLNDLLTPLAPGERAVMADLINRVIDSQAIKQA